MKRAAIASILILLSVFFVAIFLIRPKVGHFEWEAGKRIRRLCGARSDCQVRLDDLSDRDWDTLYVFLPAANDDVMSSTVGSPIHSGRKDFQHFIVLMKNGRIVFSETSDAGVENPIAGEMAFSCGPINPYFVRCPGSALMRVRHDSTEGDRARLASSDGPMYVLEQVSP